MLRDSDRLFVVRKPKIPKLIWRHKITRTRTGQHSATPFTVLCQACFEENGETY